MLKSRTPTTLEKEWLNAAWQVPCIVCDMYHDVSDSPAEYHHIDGKTKPDAHLNGIALCPQHHRNKDNNKNPRWVSRHGDGRAAFELAYMPEMELLKIMRVKVDEILQRTV
jgi:hypothetical protein